jgi:RAD51-like protein 1
MANRKLERIGIDPFLCERLATSNITTARDLLAASPLVVMLAADMSMNDVKGMIHMVSGKVLTTPKSALAVMLERSKKVQFISTGVGSFDTALKGGLLIGTISEIVGTPGAGKTQFCLSCALHTIAEVHKKCVGNVTGSGSNYELSNFGIVYIDTELKFDPNRLIQMAIENYPELYSSEFRIDAPHQIDALLQCVKVLDSYRFVTLFIIVSDSFSFVSRVFRSNDQQQ